LPQLADGISFGDHVHRLLRHDRVLKLLIGTDGSQTDAVRVTGDKNRFPGLRDTPSWPRPCCAAASSHLRRHHARSGAGVASLLAYAEERRWSRRPDAFGTESRGHRRAGVGQQRRGRRSPGPGPGPGGIPGSAAAALIMGRSS
jgi:TctA family transporter